MKSNDSLLKSNLIRNVSLINFYNNYETELYKQHGDSALLIGSSDKRWVYLSSGSPKELQELLRYVSPKYKNYATIEDWMIPYICDEKDMVWQLRCMRLYLPEEIELPESGRDVQKLEIKDAEYIYNQSEYSDLTDIDYIRDRISRGVSFGIKKEEKLLGWVMTHDDGAVGFLHVDEAYRKQGIAKKLMSAICQQLRKEGKIPFLHIEESNDKSMGLAKKLGFVEDRAVSWFEKRFTRES